MHEKSDSPPPTTRFGDKFVRYRDHGGLRQYHGIDICKALAHPYPDRALGILLDKEIPDNPWITDVAVHRLTFGTRTRRAEGYQKFLAQGGLLPPPPKPFNTVSSADNLALAQRIFAALTKLPDNVVVRGILHTLDDLEANSNFEFHRLRQYLNDLLRSSK